MNRIFILNKPIGFTSQDTVSKLKKILNEKKAGHTGTLDPMATGVLPILVGDTTKLSKYLVEHKKTYIATIELGQATDTGDSEGKIIQEKEILKENLEEKNIKEVLKSFLGIQKQTPPIYSAIKIKGKKLYEYARAGEKVEIPEREIEIYNINFIEKKLNNISFEVECSKGTYIRTLCEDIAKKLGTIGYMKSLKRIKVDKFEVEKAITFEKLEENKENIEWLKNNSYSMEDILINLPKIQLKKRKIELFLNGVMLDCEKENGVYNIYCEGQYIGTGIVKENLLKRDIIIQK